MPFKTNAATNTASVLITQLWRNFFTPRPGGTLLHAPKRTLFVRGSLVSSRIVRASVPPRLRWLAPMPDREDLHLASGQLHRGARLHLPCLHREQPVLHEESHFPFFSLNKFAAGERR